MATPIAQAFTLVRRALKILADREVTPQTGLLKSTLLQLDSTFSERNYGASSFLDFVQKLEKAGLVSLKQAGRSVVVELNDGFIDEQTGFIHPYRHTGRNQMVLNFKSNRDWFCPGSMARIALQLLLFADRLPEGDPRIGKMRGAAGKCAGWLLRNLKSVENGWMPTRTLSKS